MSLREPQADGNLENLVHYLRPALDDLRQLDMDFETYLLEMLIMALRERGGSLPGAPLRFQNGRAPA